MIAKSDVAGLWVMPNESIKPDIVIYYCHGMLVPNLALILISL